VKTAKKFITASVENISKRLNAYLEDHDADHLHKVRVDSKKLRAFVRLARSLSIKAVGKSDYTVFIDMYRAAGRIRSVKIKNKLLQKFGIDFSLPEDPNDELAIHDLSKQYKNALKGIKADLLKAAHDLNRYDVVMVLEEWDNKFRNLLSHSANLSDWHEGRKYMKRVMYLNAIIPSYPLEDFKIYNSFQEKLGDWNDLNELIGDSMIINELSSDDSNLLKQALANVEVDIHKEFKLLYI
jgi:CHAD domain-containing protein